MWTKSKHLYFLRIYYIQALDHFNSLKAKIILGGIIFFILQMKALKLWDKVNCPGSYSSLVAQREFESGSAGLSHVLCTIPSASLQGARGPGYGLKSSFLSVPSS
jgi:hypothetical protein